MDDDSVDPLLGSNNQTHTSSNLEEEDEYFDAETCFEVFLWIAIIFLLWWGGTVIWGSKFIVSWIPSVVLLVVFHFRQYGPSSDHINFRAHPLTFAIGVASKIMTDWIGITLALVAALAHVNLGNPHPETPLNFSEVLIRIFPAAFILMALFQEIVKFIFLLTLDQDPDDDYQMGEAYVAGRVRKIYSSFGQRLNLYHPYSIVMVAMGLSLGSIGYVGMMEIAFSPQHHLHWYYYYLHTFMLAPLNAATGALMGAGIAKRMFLHKSISPTKILMWPVLIRGTYFLLSFLPFRSESIEEEYKGRYMVKFSYHKTDLEGSLEIAAVNIGSMVLIIYFLQFLLVCGASYFARREVQKLMDEYEDPVNSRYLTQNDGDENL